MGRSLLVTSVVFGLVVLSVLRSSEPNKTKMARDFYAHVLTRRVKRHRERLKIAASMPYLSAPTSTLYPMSVPSLGYEYPFCPWVSSGLENPRVVAPRPLAGAIRSCVGRLRQWIRAGQLVAGLHGSGLMSAALG